MPCPQPYFGPKSMRRAAQHGQQIVGGIGEGRPLGAVQTKLDRNLGIAASPSGLAGEQPAEVHRQ